MNRLLFLTYGDSRFKKSRDRIQNEALRLNFFDKAVVENEKTIKDKSFRDACLNKSFAEVFNNKRKGGGFWLWKPYVILKHLKTLRENDILVYTDAGSTIPKCEYTKDKLNEYIKIVRNSDLGVLAFRNPHIESKWTKGDVFKHFQATDDPEIYNTRQFSAGRLHIVRKCQHSKRVYGLWWNTAKNHPNLFDDSESVYPNFSNFKCNRHDASNWSLICKTVGVEQEYDWDSIPICPTRIRG